MDFLKKFKELLVDATIGLVKQTQEKTIGLVKIEAAACYIRVMRLLHRQVLVFALILFLVVTTAAGLVIGPLALLALAPLTREVKLVLVLLLVIVDIGVPLWILNHFFSEKKWMELTKSNEMMDHVIKNG